MNAIKIGCDPELFLEERGKIVSAFGVIPGSKEEPFPVSKGAVQVDGMALEFNIDPAGSEEEFVHNIKEVLGAMQSMIPEYRMLYTPVAVFDEEYLSKQPDDATVLGCDPDYDAYSGCANPMPDSSVPFRTAAGHIHIGWKNVDEEDDVEFCERIVRELDVVLGVPSVLFDPDNTRRSLYGRAGAYRPKPYGVEYRVLSNVWVGDERLQRWVYKTAKTAVSQHFQRGILHDKATYLWARDIINSSDVEGAKAFVKRFNLELPEEVEI